MATIKVRWTVDELANVMSLFDVQRVWRATTLDPPDWTEITSVATRVPLASGVESYLFDDVAGDSSYYYAISYYNTATTEESELSDPLRADLAGYITLAEVRDEGVPATLIDDAGVIRGIERATALIDKVTGRWFEPRQRTFRLDTRRGYDLLVNIPIIALTGMTIIEETVDLDSVWVYNRHLTQGLLNPDDRDNPRVTWREDDLPRLNDRVIWYERRYIDGFQRCTLTGVFGYTELDRLDVPGETVAGSQVPTSYGETPELIKIACMRLALKYMHPMNSGDGDELAMRRRLIEERTRDQVYRLADNTNSPDNAFGLTGDVEVDTILSGFMAPMQVGVV